MASFNAKPLTDDIIKWVQSALHRLLGNLDDEDSKWLGASSGRPEPAKGRSTGYHNGSIGTGNVSYALHAPPFDRTYPLTPTPMTRRKMRKSHLVACLPIFAGLASAQLVYPNCTTGWDWASNSLGQNPCNVAAYLESTCGTGLFSIPSIPPGSGLTYSGPNAGDDNLCQCNTVTYSLVSACGACQGSSWGQWSVWRLNCSTVSSAGTYPNQIPAGTRIPHWAFLDVSVADTWNATAAQSAGDTPESTATTSASASATSGSSSSTSPTPSPKQKSSNTGAIAGGVVGGVLGLTLLVGVIAYFTRRRRWRAVARPSPFMTDQPHMAEAFGIPEPSTSPPNPKYYDPSDPSTFPSTFPTSLASPSGTAIQTTPGSEQAHSPSTPSISTGGRNRYNGLPLV